MEVKPVILGSPGEHHKILEFLHNNGDKKSYVHVDNHPDNTRPMGGFCIVKPCSVFMNDVLRNDCFEKVYWLQKNYNPENPYKIEDYNGGVWNFKDLEDAEEFLHNNTLNNIVLDINPDVLHDYPTTYSKGSMDRSELKNLIEYFKNNKCVELFSFAGTEEFLEELLN